MICTVKASIPHASQSRERDVFEGDSKTISISPGKHIDDAGSFRNVVLRNQRLHGEFKNKGHTKGRAEFEFFRAAALSKRKRVRPRKREERSAS